MMLPTNIGAVKVILQLEPKEAFKLPTHAKAVAFIEILNSANFEQPRLLVSFTVNL